MGGPSCQSPPRVDQFPLGGSAPRELGWALPVSGLLWLQLHLFFPPTPSSTHGSCVPWCCIPSLAHSFFISSPLPGNFTRFLPFSLTALSAVYSLQLPTPPKTSFLFPTPDICRYLLYAKYSSPPRGSIHLPGPSSSRWLSDFCPPRSPAPCFNPLSGL